MGLSGLLPIIHAALIFPFELLNQQAGLGYYLLEGLALITGTVFYAVSQQSSMRSPSADWRDAELIRINIDTFSRVLGTGEI